MSNRALIVVARRVNRLLTRAVLYREQDRLLTRAALLGATMKSMLITITICALAAGTARAQNIKVNPTGVNVNPNTGTTVFLTFGQVTGALRPAEATWCGELI